MLEKQKQDPRIQVTAETSVFEIVVEIARRRASLYAIPSWQCAKVIIKKWPHAFVCICVCVVQQLVTFIYLPAISTSSTAQGGGGSFKNGKLIGEVSWCHAKMAERTH